MELREMRAFVTTVEAGSLSAGARRLYISQSALSQTIHGLERQLGVVLLTRSNTGIRTTEAGSTLLTEARAILVRHNQALGRLTTRCEDIGHTVRIGMPAELPPSLLSEAIVWFGAKCPRSRVQIKYLSTTDQITTLQADGLDLGLVRERPPQELDVAMIIEEKMGVLLPSGHATKFAGPDGIRLDRLVGLRWLGFARTDCPAWYDEVSATLRGHGIHDARTDDRSPSDELKLAAVSVGNAFALAPPLRYYNLPRSVSWLPLVGQPLVRRTWAAWPADSRRSDVPLLVRYLRQHENGEIPQQRHESFVPQQSSL